MKAWTRERWKNELRGFGKWMLGCFAVFCIWLVRDWVDGVNANAAEEARRAAETAKRIHEESLQPNPQQPDFFGPDFKQKLDEAIRQEKAKNEKKP